MTRLFSNSDTTTITIKNKLFDALVQPILLHVWMWNMGTRAIIIQYPHWQKHYWTSPYQVSKQTLNAPWYTENIACRAELGRYPLSIEIKASIFSYWLRLQHETVNPLLVEAFHHVRNHSLFFDVLNNDETIRMHSTSIHQANNPSRMLVPP